MNRSAVGTITTGWSSGTRTTTTSVTIGRSRRKPGGAPSIWRASLHTRSGPCRDPRRYSMSAVEQHCGGCRAVSLSARASGLTRRRQPSPSAGRSSFTGACVGAQPAERAEELVDDERHAIVHRTAEAFGDTAGVECDAFGVEALGDPRDRSQVDRGSLEELEPRQPTSP